MRTLRSLREEDVPAASIRHSILAMKAVAGMANPLLEATVVRTGTPASPSAITAPWWIPSAASCSLTLSAPGKRTPVESRSRCAAPANRPAPPPGSLPRPRCRPRRAGDKQRAIEIYREILAADPAYAAAYINLGTIYFHLRQFERAEELYRRATEEDPAYVLAFFDLGNVLDELNRLEESIAAYRQAVSLSPSYADAHYNLALALERKGELRQALAPLADLSPP